MVCIDYYRRMIETFQAQHMRWVVHSSKKLQREEIPPTLQPDMLLYGVLISPKAATSLGSSPWRKDAIRVLYTRNCIRLELCYNPLRALNPFLVCHYLSEHQRLLEERHN